MDALNIDKTKLARAKKTPFLAVDCWWSEVSCRWLILPGFSEFQVLRNEKGLRIITYKNGPSHHIKNRQPTPFGESIRDWLPPLTPGAGKTVGLHLTAPVWKLSAPTPTWSKQPHQRASWRTPKSNEQSSRSRCRFYNSGHRGSFSVVVKRSYVNF